MKQVKIDNKSTDTFNSKSSISNIEITEWAFQGIRILYLDGDTAHKTIFDLNCPGGGIIMCFSLSGKFEICDDKSVTSFSFTNNQQNTFYITGNKLIIKSEISSLKLIIIHIAKNQYFDICTAEDEVLKTFQKKITSGKSVSLFPQNLNMDFLLLTSMSAILNCKYEDSLKRIFLFSKVVEIIVLQLEAYRSNADLKTTYIKTDYDKERILYAKDFLLKNMESPPSLKQLARVSGINEFKLKKGFKELFNQTVYEYLSDVRLELAKNDLLEKKKSISQIAFDLGYSSLQHFSNSFKRKFGVSPNQVR